MDIYESLKILNFFGECATAKSYKFTGWVLLKVLSLATLCMFGNMQETTFF